MPQSPWAHAGAGAVWGYHSLDLLLPLHLSPAQCSATITRGQEGDRVCSQPHPAPWLFSRCCLDVADGWSKAGLALPGDTVTGPPCPQLGSRFWCCLGAVTCKAFQPWGHCAGTEGAAEPQTHRVSRIVSSSTGKH